MSLFDTFISKTKYRNAESMTSTYEFCPRCEANLTLQKGYSNNLPFWNCRGCGEMLINPEVDAGDDVVWVCDGCGCMLNIQDGFVSNCGEWKCIECGFVNKIDASEMYLSEEEFQASLHDPYKGLSDSDVLELSLYEDIRNIDGRPDIILVENHEDKRKHIGFNEVSITESMANCRGKNYNSVVLLFRGAGFTNVTAIELKNLTVFNQRKNGRVESVTINGTDSFEEGDIFPKDSNVLITYHSI